MAGKQAVVVIDIQREYFPEGKLPLFDMEATADRASAVLDAARKNDLPIIHFRHEIVDGGVPLFIPGSEGAAIHPTVEPFDGEPVIVKHHANAFRDTALKQALDSEGVSEIVIVGAMVHNCVDATARAAHDFGFGVTIIEDACTTRDLDFGGTTVTADQVVTSFMAALAMFAAVVDTQTFTNQLG